MNNISKKFTRDFGILIALIVFIFAIINIYYGKLFIAVSLVLISLILLLISYKKPEILVPFSMLWGLFGELIGIISRPLIMGSLFYFIFSPIAFLARLIRGDYLVLKKKLDDTYWVSRDSLGQRDNQFYKQY